MFSRMLLCSFVFCLLSISINAEDRLVPLKALQKEFLTLKLKMQRHRGTVTVDAKVVESRMGLSEPGFAVSTMTKIQRFLSFKVISVDSGPMVHDPKMQYGMLLSEHIVRNTSFIEQPKEPAKPIRLNYWLTIKNGDLRYSFSTIKQAIPNKATDSDKK